MEKPINIKKPCPENWETMKIGLHSRFCENCSKNVIDFTGKSRKEILEYLLLNYDKKNCGRLYPSQLDFTHSDFIITINALTSKHKDTNLSFFLLAIGSMILSGCSNSTTERVKVVRSDTVLMLQDPTKDPFATTAQNDTSEKRKEVKPIEIPEIPIVGDLTYMPDTTYECIEPYPFVEIMPEFKGGLDSLMSFVQQNLNYPTWEKENNIEGIVFAYFVVDKYGKVKDAKILNTVRGSKNFNNEVLRVINNMPDWIPGKHDGKNVDVQFTLPINFSL